MNEALFITHIFCVVLWTLFALRFGKNVLIALVALQAVLANLFVVKQMSLFGFSVTCSDVFAIGGILGLNLIQEYYGKEEARSAIKASFWSLCFFAVMSKIHLLYVPTLSDTTHSAFADILGSSGRITAASIVTYFLVQKWDVFLFGKLQGWWPQKLALRLGISLTLTQFLDTILFSFLGLYGLVESMWDIIGLSFAAKCLVISCSGFFIALTKRWKVLRVQV
jgi:uncharacterized integral membrane protein (TIGR00697 family)